MTYVTQGYPVQRVDGGDVGLVRPSDVGWTDCHDRKSWRAQAPPMLTFRTVTPTADLDFVFPSRQMALRVAEGLQPVSPFSIRALPKAASSDDGIASTWRRSTATRYPCSPLAVSADVSARYR